MAYSNFFERLIDRLDKLDPESIQTHFLKLAKEKGLMETIFQSIQEGVVVLDDEGKITYANRAAERLIGFEADSARGRPASRYIREIDWDGLLRFDDGEWNRVVNSEIEVSYPEHRFLSFYIVPITFGRDGERGLVMILRDITRDRIAETTLVESERLNAVKLLAAGVAHEIGNPLNALNIHLQLLQREIAALPDQHAESVRDLADIARNEVARLDLIITQFLQAIRPAKPEMALCRADAVLAETLNLLRHEIQNRRIDVQIETRGELPRINMDSAQIKQAFFNIMRNAFQAMPDGGTLEILMQAKNPFISISFRDTGVGIATQDLGRIFEPYFTTKQRGSGLGLMIVHRIVRDHGGQIEVASKPGEGTAFTILLPTAERRIRLLRAGRRDPYPNPETDPYTNPQDPPAQNPPPPSQERSLP